MRLAAVAAGAEFVQLSALCDLMSPVGDLEVAVATLGDLLSVTMEMEVADVAARTSHYVPYDARDAHVLASCRSCVLGVVSVTLGVASIVAVAVALMRTVTRVFVVSTMIVVAVVVIQVERPPPRRR